MLLLRHGITLLVPRIKKKPLYSILSACSFNKNHLFLTCIILSPHNTGYTGCIKTKMHCTTEEFKALKGINIQYSLHLYHAFSLLLNSEFGRAGCLPMVIGGSASVNIGVLRTNFGEDEGTAAIFLILYLHCG